MDAIIPEFGSKLSFLICDTYMSSYRYDLIY